MSENQTTDLLNDCDALLDLVPDYAFGLTDPEQTRLVEAGLSRCPEAVAQLGEFRYLQEEMRANVAQVEPAAALGARLMAAVAASSAAPAAVDSMSVRPTAPSLPPAAAPSAPQIIRPRRRLRAAWLVAAAAVIALVATNAYWLTRVTSLTQSTDLITALRELQSNSAFVVTDTGALHWVRLADPQPDTNTAAFMMWNSQSKTGLLYAHAFPELQPGYKYHVWLTRPNERVFMGILQVDANGNGALLFSSPEPINDFAWAWVTAENGTPVNPNDAAVVKGELNPA